MSLNTVNYMNLSALAYINFSESARNKNIGSLISEKIIKNEEISKPELSPLTDPSNPLRSYTLLNFTQNSPSGFSAAAFKSPSGEIVFSFQGTKRVSRTPSLDL